MKRTYFPGIKDVVVVTDPAEIRTVSMEPALDRKFTGPASVLNRKRRGKMLRIFSVAGRRYPTMVPRTDQARADAQNKLWLRLNEKAEQVKDGPAELEALAELVRGAGDAGRIGPLVQQTVGRLFVEDFTATAESWAAACMVLEAAGSRNVMKMLGWRVSGKLERAKKLLADMVNGDMAGVNGISVALHHVVDGMKKMRQLAADASLLSSMTTAAVVDACLFPANTVTREAKTAGEIIGCPFQRGSLFILGLGSACKGTENRDLLFLSGSWSRCPAEKWVPALLEGVWKRTLAG